MALLAEVTLAVEPLTRIVAMRQSRLITAAIVLRGSIFITRPRVASAVDRVFEAMLGAGVGLTIRFGTDPVRYPIAVFQA